MNIIPQEQASHFCRLLLNDGTTVSPLGYHAQRILAPNDSMTVEQQFMSYVFYENNWLSLRLFPQSSKDGTVRWYAPSDVLQNADNSQLSSEHQKYIREFFTRLQKEVEAGNWTTVDAYIDRLTEYQCTFGSASQAEASMQPLTVILLFGILIVTFLILSRKKSKRLSE